MASPGGNTEGEWTRQVDTAKWGRKEEVRRRTNRRLKNWEGEVGGKKKLLFGGEGGGRKTYQEVLDRPNHPVCAGKKKTLALE